MLSMARFGQTGDGRSDLSIGWHMLQKLSFEDDGEAAGQQFRPASYQEEAGQSHFLQPSFYWQLIKRRALYFVIPFILVLVVGLAVAVLLPATYVSEGKILVQSQQIPTELVRPTVTSAAQERIQVIEQRTMTRENLLAIIDKFQLFPEQRTLMSASQLVELMKKNAKIEPLVQPLAFSQVRSRGDNPTIVFTVGFEYSDPQTASRVANELVTRILSEDLRDRTSRATDTTKFLAREVQKLQADNAAVDAKIALAKLAQAKSGSNTPDQPATQLAQLKVDLAQKSALYSDRHPVMQALKRQIGALEKVVAPSVQTGPDALAPLDELETQQENIQKNLEAASVKLAAARLGETLEKDQQSEKLEVIEQPTAPQEPIKPKRLKLSLAALAVAFAAGGGLTFFVEMLDKGIRKPSDILSVVNGQLIVSTPYIATLAELRWRKRRALLIIFSSLLVLLGVS